LLEKKRRSINRRVAREKKPARDIAAAEVDVRKQPRRSTKSAALSRPVIGQYRRSKFFRVERIVAPRIGSRPGSSASGIPRLPDQESDAPIGDRLLRFPLQAKNMKAEERASDQVKKDQFEEAIQNEHGGVG
jgi:hypothetical protein